MPAKKDYNEEQLHSLPFKAGGIMGILDFFKPKPSKQDLIAAEYHHFIERLTQQGSLEPITVGVSLKKNEFAYLETQASLHETKSVSTYSSSGRVGIRVMKGVYIGSGSSGRSQSHQEMGFINEGVLIITNQRLLFVGSTENRIIPLNKIVSVDQLADAIGVFSETRTKTMYFGVDNPLIWISVYQMISKTGAFGSLVKESR
jgi:hypothetical protein